MSQMYEPTTTNVQDPNTVTRNEAPVISLNDNIQALFQSIQDLRTTLNALIILLYNNGTIKLEDLEERERFINLLNKEDIK